MEKKLQVFGSSICGFEGMYQKNKIVLAKMEKVLYTIPVSAVDIPR